MIRLARFAAAGLLAGLALLLGATPALAHAEFEGSDPADGATLDTGPQKVTLTFSDTMQQGFNTITVIGPDGKDYVSGEVQAQGDEVSATVGPLGPAGRYEIGYRVLSDDGHPVSGKVGFTLTAAGTGTGSSAAPIPSADAAPSAAPAAQSAPAESGGMPVWPWIVGAVVLVGAGVAVAMRLGRS
ncbi:copper resistance protein CopC [Pseudonocardia halophobica]|uniref:Copper resistance protein C n=1 Tax=Pseudonocardia halophobica TaxID=29401 RepID=A0A9W6KYG0_9PSEU|nr:copper resistance CopC family protein [Pseudonocardia halophobica]GLL08989.1 copper resistance protein C [Pseudonocardia halophobica]